MAKRRGSDAAGEAEVKPAVVEPRPVFVRPPDPDDACNQKGAA